MTIKASNFPTTRPSLDLNFAQTKRLDPRVTFSRASTATYTDANGVIQTAASGTPRFDHNPTTGESLGLLVEESRTNLLTYSEHFDNAAWFKQNSALVIPNSAIAPDGTLTADKLVLQSASNDQFWQSTGVLNGAHTVSIWIRADAPVSLSFGFYDSASDVQTINVTTSWQRVTRTRSSGLTNADRRACWLYYQSAGTATVYIWGAQLEAGSFPTSYIPTPATFTSRASTATYYDANGVIQTAASGVARSNAFLPDSSGVFRPAGLLLEESRTNLIVGSQTFNTGSWNVDGISITNNATTAPDGTVTATSVTQGSGNNRTYHFDNNGAANRILTIFAKSNAGSSLTLTGAINYGSNYAASVVLNTSNGTVTGATGCSSVALPNGWYRFSIPVNIATGSGNANYYQIVGPSSSVYIWGMQVETGSYPTSYIPTTTSTVTRAADVSTSSTVTRSADVASMTGTNFSSWYREDAGTFFASVKSRVSTGSPAIIGLGASTGSVYQAYAATAYAEWWNGAGSALPTSNAVTWSNGANVAAAYTTANRYLCLNGGTVASNASTLPNGGLLRIGAVYNNSNPTWNSTISRLTYWPQRLPDATLQTITT